MYRETVSPSLTRKREAFAALGDAAVAYGTKLRFANGTRNSVESWYSSIESKMSWTLRLINDKTKLAVVDSPKAISMMYALDLLPMDEGTFSYCAIDADTLENDQTAAKLFNRLVNYHKVEVLIDSREDDIPVKVVPAGRYGERAIYKGELPENIILPYAKALFMETASNLWSNSFIVGKDNLRNGKRLSAIKKARVLASAIMPEGDEVTVLTGHGTGAQLKGSRRDLLMSGCTLNVPGLPDKVRKSVESIQRFRDITMLWEYCADQYDIAMRLDDKDLENEDELRKKIQQVGEWIGVDNFIETYNAGVPVEDIVI